MSFFRLAGDDGAAQRARRPAPERLAHPAASPAAPARSQRFGQDGGGGSAVAHAAALAEPAPDEASFTRF